MKNRNPGLEFIIWVCCLCLILVLILIPVSCIYFDPLHPYAHIVYWAKSYGANEDEQMNTVIPLSDGGSIIAGYTYSFGAGGQDAWLMQLDQEGNVIWEKAYGTQLNDRICSIRTTSDNNVIIVGNMCNADADENDIWVMKCDSDGNILWEERFGWELTEEARGIDETADDGYIIAGKSDSFSSGDVDNQNALLIKFTAENQVSWMRIYGGMEDDEASIILVTDDGDLVFGGNTFSFGAGDSDFWLVKTDSEGEIIWAKAYGKSGEDRLCSLTQTRDNGFILTGLLDPGGAAGIDHIWVYQVMKIDSNGAVMWQKSLVYEFFSKPWITYTSSVEETGEGNYVVAITAEIDETKGLDVHVLKFDQTGNILWQRTYGGSADDYVMCVKEVPDYGYIVTGGTCSFGVKKEDSWVIKLLPNGECSPLDNTSSINTELIPCQVTDTNTLTEKSLSPSIPVTVDSTVTVTDCTVRQQAP